MVGAVAGPGASPGDGGIGARLVLAGGPWAGARVDLAWRGETGGPGALAVVLRSAPTGLHARDGGPLGALADRLRAELRRRGLPAEDVHVEGAGANQVRRR